MIPIKYNSLNNNELGNELRKVILKNEDGRYYIIDPSDVDDLIQEIANRLEVFYDQSKQMNIIALARDTREAQKKYFKTRRYEELQASKVLEIRLDKALQDYYHSDPQTRLDI